MNPPVTGRFVMPDIIATHFFLREGDSVADFGAGSGFFLQALSTAVGDSGKVFACEIQKPLVDTLGAAARDQGLGNVQPLWCDLEAPDGIKIQTETLDAAILINTLFMIEDKTTAIVEMSRTMRSGAKLFVVDWTESWQGMGPTPDLVVSKDEAIRLHEANGYVLEREFPSGDHHYGLAFRKV